MFQHYLGMEKMKHIVLTAIAFSMVALAPGTASAAVGVAQKDTAAASIKESKANNRHGYRQYGYGYGRPVYRQSYRPNYQWDRSWHRNPVYDWRSHRARYQNYYRPGPYYAPNGYYNRSSFNIGFSIGSPYYQQNYWISDPGYYRLPNHYGSYRWIRHYNDAILVDTRTGYVVDAVRDFYY
jgi:Ni/Co efflux regulator RcnB